MNKKGKEAARWFSQAQKDLEDADYNLRGSRYNIACFLSQQSAEKALKAYLYYKGERQVWGHSVADLVDDSASLDASFKHLFDIAGLLDMYYIPTRYPDGLPGGIPADAFYKEDAQDAVRLATALIDFVKKKINFQDGENV